MRHRNGCDQSNGALWKATSSWSADEEKQEMMICQLWASISLSLSLEKSWRIFLGNHDNGGLSPWGHTICTNRRRRGKFIHNGYYANMTGRIDFMQIQLSVANICCRWGISTTTEIISCVSGGIDFIGQARKVVISVAETRNP